MFFCDMRQELLKAELAMGPHAEDFVSTSAVDQEMTETISHSKCTSETARASMSVQV